MEMINIPKEEYEKMRNELKRLKGLEKVDWRLVGQFKEGLDDLKAGRIKRVA